MFEVTQILPFGGHENLVKGRDVNYLVSNSKHTYKMYVELHLEIHIIRSLK